MTLNVSIWREEENGEPKIRSEFEARLDHRRPCFQKAKMSRLKKKFSRKVMRHYVELHCDRGIAE